MYYIHDILGFFWFCNFFFCLILVIKAVLGSRARQGEFGACSWFYRHPSLVVTLVYVLLDNHVSDEMKTCAWSLSLKEHPLLPQAS